MDSLASSSHTGPGVGKYNMDEVERLQQKSLPPKGVALRGRPREPKPEQRPGPADYTAVSAAPEGPAAYIVGRPAEPPSNGAPGPGQYDMTRDPRERRAPR
jgi:hypothetical protein